MLSQQVFDFLEDLKENNHRDWFQAHQDRYADYKKAYKNTVEAFIAEMSKGDESLKNLEFKDCSFRINRDIRFSKDKSPYKTNLGIWMSAGSKNTNLGGYYIHIEKGASFIAGGIHYPDSNDLKKMRREIAGFYEDLENIVEDKNFKKIYGTLDRDENNSLKTSPKDYDKDHPAIEFLKLKSFTASAKMDDKELTDKNFVENTSKKLLVLKPLVEFINRALTTE
ncbi:DUF2461 domain-containing protein [Flavobacterium salilacus subsp. salilacus]|uniref:DUF2461 domain-containing protein n=1 Tax=Flavobacterium TaxID=237 RepID=UPI0010755580|nr:MULTISPECIES: DUF2461 domain-containing protein [Flavobacterium]KAF2519399.1 DUF2461 domain-containing protein [Flavobacterium salilacus subsp. salilacus]MBE1614709.1 DUF2461 domain-containing protein [Flavobacterium sp. SaA2.13]